MSSTSQRKANKALYDQRRAAGLCVRCGATAARNRHGKSMARCPRHLDEAASSQQERRDGLRHEDAPEP